MDLKYANKNQKNYIQMLKMMKNQTFNIKIISKIAKNFLIHNFNMKKYKINNIYKDNNQK